VLINMLAIYCPYSNLFFFCCVLVALFYYSCDGPCMRSFHAKEGSGEDSYCDTLGYTEAEVDVCVVLLSDANINLNFLL